MILMIRTYRKNDIQEKVKTLGYQEAPVAQLVRALVL